MAMENQPFIDDVPINSSIGRGFSAAIFDYRMVTCSIQKKQWNQSSWQFLNLPEHEETAFQERNHYLSS